MCLLWMILMGLIVVAGCHFVLQPEVPVAVDVCAPLIPEEALLQIRLPAAVRRWAPLLYQAAGGDLDRAVLLGAVVQVESSGRPWVVSRAGAVGLMQVRPATARDLRRWYGVALPSPWRLRDPRVNIAFGARYLDRLIVRFGNLEDALEAYYRGPRTVDRWRRQGVTRRPYAARVLRVMGGCDVPV